jgi:hypothetical protein
MQVAERRGQRYDAPMAIVRDHSYETSVVLGELPPAKRLDARCISL